MKELVGTFNQEKALVGALSVIVKTGCGTDRALHSTSSVSTLPPHFINTTIRYLDLGAAVLSIQYFYRTDAGIHDIKLRCRGSQIIISGQDRGRGLN